MDRTHWGLAAAMLATALGAGLFFGLWQPGAPAPTPQRGAWVALPSTLQEGEEFPEEWVVVHVAGRVLHPGLVRVRSPARVGDVIVAAGGARADARLGDINLAGTVFDGDRVVVPGPQPESGQGEIRTSGGPDVGGKVNLNRATAQQLEEVPGVGPVLAARIVDHRVGNGPFQQLEDLLDVPGIGEKKLSGLREYVALP